MTHQSEIATGQIIKVDADKRLVFGWASIIKDENGKILLDRQDDFIDSEDELETAAYDYVLTSRDGGEMHIRRGVSKMVESVVFTEEKQRAMGIPAGSMPTGWWIGFQVADDRVWEQVKKGEYAGFSVHGTGRRVETQLPIDQVTEIGKAHKPSTRKVKRVMHEFKTGKLKSSTGATVTDPKQAIAIAISEQQRAKMKKLNISEIVRKHADLEKRDYSTEQRNTMADAGEAMPDGSFPIKTRADVSNALQSIGRAKNRDAVLRHIRSRCKDLKCEDMLPDWAVSKDDMMGEDTTPMENTGDCVDALKTLLADSVSVYHEAHGFHWNVKGADFAQYHALFESIYSDIYGSIDPIAENILKLGENAPFQLSEFIGLRTIAESQPANDPQSMATELLDALDGLLDSLNDAFECATNENQQGIANFVAERIDATQKWMWQLRSSVGIQKGDMPGHEFHGNQYTSGKSRSAHKISRDVQHLHSHGTPSQKNAYHSEFNRNPHEHITVRHARALQAAKNVGYSGIGSHGTGVGAGARSMGTSHASQKPHNRRERKGSASLYRNGTRVKATKKKSSSRRPKRG